MSAQHTPGPWRIVIDGTCSGAWPHIVGPDVAEGELCAGDAIAELPTCFVERAQVRRRGMPATYGENSKRFLAKPNHDQVMADARLIAAAPDLLAAGIAFSKLYGHLWDSADTKGAGFLSPESVQKYDAVHEQMRTAIARATGGAL